MVFINDRPLPSLYQGQFGSSMYVNAGTKLFLNLQFDGRGEGFQAAATLQFQDRSQSCCDQDAIRSAKHLQRAYQGVLNFQIIVYPLDIL